MPQAADTPHPMDTEGRIKIGTVNTPDLAASVADYERWLGYQTVHQATLDDAFAAHLQAPAMAGRPFALLAPASGAPVYVRLVEGSPVADYVPLRSFGWASLEMTVRDCDGLADKLRQSPFKIIGEPAYLDFSDAIYPMQVTGRAGEVIYLNQVNRSLPDFDLPIAQSEVDHIFITILATADMQAGVDYYRTAFGWQQGNTYDVPYSVINNAFGLDAQTPHKLSMNCVGRMVNNEVDQYPEHTAERPVIAGELPPGVAMISYIADRLDPSLGHALAPPTTFRMPPYDGRRTAMYRGTAGELVELIERDGA